MRVEITMPKDQYAPARWTQYLKTTGNSVTKHVGSHLGFEIQVREEDESGHMVNYQLIHTPIYQKTEKTEALLLKVRRDRIQVLGRVKLPVDRLEGWTNNLIQSVKSHQESSAVELAKGVLNELTEISKNGLNPVYHNFDDYLCDMWANFPWDAHGQALALQWIVQQPELKEVSKVIETKSGVKFAEYFEAMEASFRDDPDPEKVDFADEESSRQILQMCGFKSSY